MKKLIINYFYVLLNQVVLIFLPFITMPYVTRILQANGLGRHTFALSIVSVFSIFLTLSIPIYGAKEIAAQNNTKEIEKTFAAIFKIQFFAAIVVTLAYSLFLLTPLAMIERQLFIIHLITLLTRAIDVSWYFVGKEQAKKVVIRTVLTKIIGTMSIFLFVNSPNDVFIYTLILAMSLFSGQALVWIPLLKEVKFKKVRISEVKKHLKPIAILFLPQLFIMMYTNLNNVVLGAVVGRDELAFYAQAVVIMTMVISVLASISTIMLPRMASEFSKGNVSVIKKNVANILQFVLLVSVPLAFGLIAISYDFVIAFFGLEFVPTALLLALISPNIIIVGLANVFGVQLLIATNQQKKYTISVIVGAILSLIVNFVLVFHIGALATVFALLAAEVTGLLIQIFYTREYFDLHYFSKELVKYLVYGGIMYAGIWFASSLINLSIINLIIFKVIIGCFIYITILIITKNELLSKVWRLVIKKAN